MSRKATLFYLPLLLALAGAQAAPPKDGPDPLLPLLSGEFALQRGDVAGAARDYAQAAQLSHDPGVAERAARIALLADDAGAARSSLQRWRQLTPDAAGALQLDALLALRDADADAALRSLRGLAALPDGWRLVVQVFASHSSGAITADVLARLVDGGSLPADEPEVWIAMGTIADRLGADGLALRLSAQALERFADEPKVWLWLAEQRARHEDQHGARAAVDKALELGPEDVPVRLAAAAQLNSLGEPLAAAEILASGPQTDATRAGRAAYLARSENPEAMQALYDELRAMTDEAEDSRLLLLGQLAELLKRPEEALRWYQQIRDGEQRNQARLRTAVLLDETERLEEALSLLRQLQVADSDDGEVLRDAYLLEGELLLRRDRDEDALSAYQRGLEAFDDDPALLYARALAYERGSRLSEAEADLRRILELDPENADALNALGYTLADRTERFEEALGYIRRALELKPESPAIIDSMGWVLYRMGEHDEALRHLRRAFDQHPDPEVAAHLGEVLWVSGRQDEAREIWSRGAELDAENRTLQRTIERFTP